MNSINPQESCGGISRRQALSSLIGLGMSGLLTSCGGGGGGSSSTSTTSTTLPLVDNPRVLASPEGDAIVYAGDDPSNPLNIFRTPITLRLQVLAADLAQGTTSVFHAIDRFMTYIDEFAVGFASLATPDATVLERIGACGSYTGVLLAMARCQGIPGRYINLYNYPVNQGHTVAELQVNGRWMLFDATTHVYYIDPTLAAPATPLSYAETKFRYENSLPVARVGQNDRLGRDLYSGPDIFLNANPQGVIGPEYPMRFPLTLDVVQKSVITPMEFTTENQGVSYIGAAGINAEHSWTFTGLVAGQAYRFVMEPLWLGGDFLPGDDNLFTVGQELVGATLLNSPITYFDFSGGLASDLVVEFTALGASVGLNVSHPYRGPGFRYVRGNEYRLEAI